MRTGERVVVGGPYFEDFEIGQVFDDAPALTITEGHAALHQAIVGDRLRLPLDAGLERGPSPAAAEPLAHPNLVCDVAIGQSTAPTQRVRGNLFYRGLVLQRPVFIGDTLRTRTEIVALKQNRPARRRHAPGLVVLRMQDRGPGRAAGAGLLALPDDPAPRPVGAHRARGRLRVDPGGAGHGGPAAAVPGGWRFDAFRERAAGAISRTSRRARLTRSRAATR